MFINVASFYPVMETTVTRGGQVTLAKRMREKLGIKEGDKVMLNFLGDSALLSKRDPAAFDKGGFLPSDFGKTLLKLRSTTVEARLRKLKLA